MEYTSKTPDVWCLFRNESDDYTYSVEILIGVFLEEIDAENALTEITTKLGFKPKDNEYEIRPYFLNEIDWEYAAVVY